MQQLRKNPPLGGWTPNYAEACERGLFTNYDDVEGESHIVRCLLGIKL